MNNFTKNILFILTLGLITVKAIAQPVMTLPTVTTVTNAGATLGGTIAVPNAASPTNPSGSTYIGSTTLASDITFQDATGSYFHPRSGMPPATQIFFVAYGTNGSGTSISSESSFYTLSNPPIAQPASFSVSSVTSSAVNLSFTAPNDVTVAASGYAIFRIGGATLAGITSVNLPNAASPTNPSGSTYIGSTTLASDITFQDATAAAGTQYTYALVPFGYNGAQAATYNYLITSYKTVTTYTLSTQPLAQPASFSVSSVTSSAVNLSFTAPNDVTVAASGYAIFRKGGATLAGITSVNLPNAASPTNPSGSTYIGSTTLASDITFQDATVVAGTQYTYALVPFGYNGAQAATYNYLITGYKTVTTTTLNATSTITLNGGTTTDLVYVDFPTVGGTLINTGASKNSVSLGKFRITDLGGDGASTTLTSVTISIAKNTNVSEIAIFDSGNNNRGQFASPGASVVFSSLTGISAANSGTDDFEIWATFKNIVTDQDVITLTITGATTTGSGLASFAATTGLTENKIKVTSNQFVFNPATLPNTAPNANFAPLTVTAVDANGNIQLARSNTVTLSLFSGTGTLNGTPGIVQNLIGGTTTFPNLSITAAGVKTIRATYGIAGVSAATIPINITTPGVLVTAGTVTNMCYSGDYQTISPITITERDPADFASGGNFSLILPTGFEFNQSVTTAPTISGNEINTISNLSYPAVDKVLFSYNISGTSNATLDQIVINGLQVNYTGNIPATSVNLIRFGGTAVQVGNATSDGKIYCTLTSANSATVVNFGVQSIGTDPAIGSTTTTYSATSKTVELIGNPAGGVFSGTAAVFSAGKYTFSPTSVGVGSYIIKYIYTETTGQHCQVTVQKTFSVVANYITNLINQYCSNAAFTTGLAVPQPTIDAFATGRGLLCLGVACPSGTYILKDFVYWQPTTNTFLPIIDTNGNNTFDPTNPQFAYSINTYGAVWVGNRIKTVIGNIEPGPSGPGSYTYVQYTYIRVFLAPSMSFNLPSAVCVNSTPISLAPLVTPIPTTPSTDKFLGTGVTGSSLVYSFDPSSVPGASSSPQLVNITYQFTDANVSNGGCSNQIIKPITVYPIPAAPLIGGTNSPVSVCKGSTPVPLTATSSPGVISYSWYKTSVSLANRLQQGDNFNPLPPDFDKNTAGSYLFYLTQTLYANAVSGFSGCESTAATTVSVDVTQPVNLALPNAPVAICAGGKSDLSSLGLSITGGVSAGTWSSLDPLGKFTKLDQITIDATSAGAKYYIPSAAESLAGSAVIKITSDTPLAPNQCPLDFKNVLIPISQAISINSIIPISVCPGQSSSPIVITAIINGAGVTTATWSSTIAQGTFQNASTASVPNKPFSMAASSGIPVQVIYTPTPAEVSSGSNISLSDISVTSNANLVGGCSAANQTMTLNLSAAPKITVGLDQIICADQSISLTGNFTGAATSAIWSASGTGALGSQTLNNPITTNYTLDPINELSNPSDQSITFILTTNTPTAPCIAAFKKVNVLVHPIPQRPAIAPITFPTGQTVFCTNDILVTNLTATGDVGNTFNWYTNATATGVPIFTGVMNTNAFVNNSIPGKYSFYATQKTPFGCESKGQIPNSSPTQFDLAIYPNPVLQFKVNGTNGLTGLCLNDITTFDATSSTIAQVPLLGLGSIDGYQWDFADQTTKTALLTSPITTHTYKNLGNYNVILKGVSDKGCSSTVTASSLPSIHLPELPNNSVLIIGPYPITDFLVKDQCLNDLTKFGAIDTSSPAATISKWDWTFGNGTTQTVQNPNLTYAASGIYNVSLTQTSNLGCINSISKKAYILPQVKFTAANQFTYAEGFENNNNAPNNGGWAPEVYLVKSNSSATSSWNLPASYGTTITSAATGSKAWVAGLTGTAKTYNTNETSVLNAPCFDISGLAKPVISFDYFEDTWKRNDGVYVQFSTDNGVSWFRLGTKGKGIEWYDNSFITGLSGSGSLGQAVGQEGWDGQSGGWKTGRYSLNDIPSKTFRLRFYFGSQGSTDQSVTSAYYNGFGLDNIFIQNSNRTVLAESFSNAAATGSAAFNDNFKNFQSSVSSLALVKIQYRTAIGGVDAESALNPADPMARAAFYGVTNAQNGLKGLMDGSEGSDFKLELLNQRFNGNIVSNGPADNYFASRALVPSPLNIALTPGVAGDSLTVSADLTTLPIPITTVGHQYVVQMAIVELKGGQYLLRKLLPNAAGKPLTALAANATQNIKYSWKVSAPINPGNLSAICFVQDLITQDILQAASATFSTAPPLVTGVEPASGNLNFYPIPADKDLIVMLSEEAVVTTPLIMYDAVGKSIHQSSIEKGQRSTTIDTKGFSEGIYIIQLETDKGTVRRKVMVVHP